MDTIDIEETMEVSELFAFWACYDSIVAFKKPRLAIYELKDVTEQMNHRLANQNAEQFSGLNILRHIEILLHWICSSLKHSSDLDGIAASEIKKLRLEVEGLITALCAFVPSYQNDDRAHRIDCHFQEIVEAIEHCTRRREGSHLGSDDEDDASWQPFFRSQSCFGTEEERLLVTRLRQLCIDIRNTSRADILARLECIFNSFPANSLRFKLESTRDMAIRLAVTIFRESYIEGSPLAAERNAVFAFYLHSLNHSLLLGEETTGREDPVTYVLREFAINRAIPTNQPLDHEDESRPELEQEPNPGSSRTSELWTKLGTLKSKAELVDKAMTQKCSVCLVDEDVTSQDFAILDKCWHFFCSDCISKWFEEKSTCPSCRAVVFTWTTRDHFLSHLERSDEQTNIDSPERPQQDGSL